MSVSPRFWAFAMAILLSAAALLFVLGRGYTGEHGTVLAAEGQAFVKDPDRSVGDLLSDAAKEVGTEISVVDFRRFKLGEAGGE